MKPSFPSPLASCAGVVDVEVEYASFPNRGVLAALEYLEPILRQAAIDAAKYSALCDYITKRTPPRRSRWRSARDGFIELASAGVLMWRLSVELRHRQKFSERAEQIASRIGGGLLFALAIYVTAAAL